MPPTTRGRLSIVASCGSRSLPASLFVAILAVLLMFAWADHVEAQSGYRMLVNHGAGWSGAGDFQSLEDCKREAAIYAAKHSAQAGCAAVSALEQQAQEQARAAEQQRADAQFQEAAAICAKRARVKIIHKPGTEVTVLGTVEQRFAFEKCMADRGQPTQ